LAWELICHPQYHKYVNRPAISFLLTISKDSKLEQQHTEARTKQPLSKLSTTMKLASILSLVAFVASPLSAYATVDQWCAVTGTFKTDYDDPDPSAADKAFASSRIKTSYNACHNISSTPGEMVDDTLISLTITSEEVPDDNLRGSNKVGRYVYSAWLSASLGASCHLCSNDDDSFFYSPAVVPNPAAVSVVLEEKKLAVQNKKKHQHAKWLGQTDLERWQDAWCDELNFEAPWEYAYDCVITPIVCPAEEGLNNKY
jgi:hypothetical protein